MTRGESSLLADLIGPKLCKIIESIAAWSGHARTTAALALCIPRRPLSMHKLLALIVVAVIIGVAQVASAGPLEDGQAAYDRGDYATALRLWRPLAEQGDAKAQFRLGEMYQTGHGVPQDYVRAYMWFDVVTSARSDETGKGAAAVRAGLATVMTPLQITLAQTMATRCRQLDYKHCDDRRRITTIAPPKAKTATPTPSPKTITRAPTPAPSSAQSIRMQKQGDVYVVPVAVNNAITLNFVVDSGASYVSIPSDIVQKLMRTGTLRKSDFLGTATFRLADGSTVPSSTFRIRSLKIGDRVVENVTGNVAPAMGGLLLGQSFLSRFKSWAIDNSRHTLVLE